jgi:molecular chaperone GrpE (heat shock protein)
MSKEKKQQDKPQQKDDKKVEELEKKTAELTEALQRERADSINLRRRMEEDRNKLADLHKASVVRELLPAFDNLEDDGGELEIVCEELQSGYQLGDEIIRHAMVKVKMEKKND